MTSKVFAFFSILAMNVLAASSASAASGSTVTVDFAVRTAHKLCDLASPVPKSASMFSAAREKNRDCLEDVLTSLSSETKKKKEMSKSEFYGIVLNVCDEHSGGIFSRYTNCLRQARKLLSFDKNLVEMRGCKNAVCVESVLRCEKDFPFMKYGVRNRESSVAMTILNQGKSRAEAFEQWSELSLLEVTDKNAAKASQCLLHSYDIYKSNDDTEIIRNSIRMILSNIRADFPDSVGYTATRIIESRESTPGPTPEEAAPVPAPVRVLDRATVQ